MQSPRLLTCVNKLSLPSVTTSTQPTGSRRVGPPLTNLRLTSSDCLGSINISIAMSHDLTTSQAPPTTLLMPCLATFTSLGPFLLLLSGTSPER
ncbi:hypothetical protein ACHAWF_003548 [Thalassiosira exigua]